MYDFQIMVTAMKFSFSYCNLLFEFPAYLFFFLSSAGRFSNINHFTFHLITGLVSLKAALLPIQLFILSWSSSSCNFGETFAIALKFKTYQKLLTMTQRLDFPTTLLWLLSFSLQFYLNFPVRPFYCCCDQMVTVLNLLTMVFLRVLSCHPRFSYY